MSDTCIRLVKCERCDARSETELEREPGTVYFRRGDMPEGWRDEYGIGILCPECGKLFQTVQIAFRRTILCADNEKAMRIVDYANNTLKRGKID